MDTFQWPQGIGVLVRAVENTRPYTTENYKKSTIRPLNCPRCKSKNTKFCYYNNYSISQPRYLCKTCKRYWTEGGNLRNVPVGGGSRKNKRPSSSSSKKVISNLSSPKISPDQNPKIDDGQSLNIDFNPLIYNGMSEFGDLPFELNFENNLNPQSPNFCSPSFSHDLPVNSFISMPVFSPNSVFSPSSFNNYMHDCKPSLSFSLDGLENGYGNNWQAVQENATSSRIIFPFEELKPISTSDHQFEQDLWQGDSNEFWNGMINGGSW